MWIRYFIVFFAFVWLLAVFKVFILDDTNAKLAAANRIVAVSRDEAAPVASAVGGSALSSGVKKAEELAWPPLQLDGSIQQGDGSDVMPMLNLSVPRFWLPKQGVDYNTVGTKVGGYETIYLMIASYRDFQCHETITSAYERADHPERLYIGAVDQTVPGDTGCLDLEIPCSTNPNQPICKYRSQIVVYHMDAQTATGPVTARHIGDRMYREQYFVMQMDAHCQFVRHWDTQLIQQWRNTGNELAVLT
jgi:hypothetical protein